MSSLTVSGPLSVPKPLPKEEVMKNARKFEDEAEFPLRQSFAATNLHVRTNHFSIALDPKIPMYEYEIKGLEDIGKKATRICIERLIAQSNFLSSNRARWVTDYRHSIVSWIKLPDQELKMKTISRCDNQLIDLHMEPVSRKHEPVPPVHEPVDTTLLERYVKGEVEPTKVSRLSQHVKRTQLTFEGYERSNSTFGESH